MVFSCRCLRKKKKKHCVSLVTSHSILVGLFSGAYRIAHSKVIAANQTLRRSEMFRSAKYVDRRVRNGVPIPMVTICSQVTPPAEGWNKTKLISDDTRHGAKKKIVSPTMLGLKLLNAKVKKFDSRWWHRSNDQTAGDADPAGCWFPKHDGS